MTGSEMCSTWERVEEGWPFTTKVASSGLTPSPAREVADIGVPVASMPWDAPQRDISNRMLPRSSAVKQWVLDSGGWRGCPLGCLE